MVQARVNAPGTLAHMRLNVMCAPLCLLLASLVGACGETGSETTVPGVDPEVAEAFALDAGAGELDPAEAVRLTFRAEDVVGTLEGVADVIDHRLRSLGWGSATVESVENGDQGDAARIVCLVRDGEMAHRFRVIGMISRRGTFAFRLCVPEGQAASERDLRESLGEFYEPSQPNWRWLPGTGDDDQVLVVVPRPGSVDDFTERDLAKATPQTIDESDVWYLEIEFVEERKEALRAFSEMHLRRQMAIVIDGIVVVRPIVASPLPGVAVIEGPRSGFSKDEAFSLALLLGMKSSYDATLALDSVDEPESR